MEVTFSKRHCSTRQLTLTTDIHMQTLLIVMMLAVCLTFILKQTFHGMVELMAATVVLAFFTGMMWPFAIEQSTTQIAAWMANQQLMLDMAVLLSIDVALTLLFCVTHVDVHTAEHVSARKCFAYRALKFFPGLLIFPVLFCTLVKLVFTFTGMDFQVISWGMAAVVFVLIPSLTLGAKWLLPERPIRLEMLFLLDVLLGLMGIVGTVNGRTAVSGISEVDFKALLAVALMVVAGTAAGLMVYRIKMNKRNKQII